MATQYSDLDKFYIPTGIPVAFDNETKEMIPFFMQVYSDMIIWKDTFTGSKMEQLINNESIDTSKIKEFAYGAYKTFNYLGWRLEIPSGEYYIARQTLNVANNFTLVEDLARKLYVKLDLPFPLADDSEFRVSMTLNANNENLRTSILSFNSISDNGYISAIEINLQNPIYSYHTNFYEMADYLKSYVYLEVRGNTTLDDKSGSNIPGYTNINNIPTYNISAEVPSEPGLWIEPIE